MTQVQDSQGPLFRARSAAKTYPDGTRALEDIDLVIRKGEFVSLIGPSGCGKSTLLRMIAGLVAPSSGAIEWRGAREEAEKRAFVFQDPTLMPWARLKANVRLPLDLAGVPRPQAEHRVDRALDMVGLSRFAHHYPRQLSGGMQMRASIARALVDEPQLLLMDEPFGALDEITRNRMDEDLLALRERQGFTAVFVTHSIYEAVFLSTRVIVMTSHPGRIFGEVAVDEPYPRASGYRVSERFAQRCGELSEQLSRASAVDAVEGVSAP
jgi:NitT/TauT family transport system ATP-binding protein